MNWKLGFFGNINFNAETLYVGKFSQAREGSCCP